MAEMKSCARASTSTAGSQRRPAPSWSTRPPKPMTPQLNAFFLALKAAGEDLGLAVDWKPTGGCCDGNNIAAAGIPVIDTLGVRGANIHSSAEYAKLDSLVERAKLSALLLLKIAAGDLPNPGAFVTEKP